MSMPKVSVIIPNFNHALFLNQRINSVLNQTYQDFELIILDDCSTDNSKEVIEQYSNHPRISHIVYNEMNSGSTFKQWEKGIGLAKGEFVWIAESDDWAELNFLENLVIFIAKNDDIGFVYSDSNVYEAGVKVNTFSKINNTFTKTIKWNNSYVAGGHDELGLLSLFCFVNNASAALFRRTALDQIFPLSNSFRFMGDWFVYIQLANRNKIGYLHLPLNNYRYHTANVSKDVNKHLGYVRERFIISNYLLKNCLFLNKDKLNKNLYDYAAHKVSLKKKNILVYKELASINFILFCTLIWHSIFVLYKQKIKKIIR